MRLKQRIVRILVHEIVADTDEAAGEIVLLIHWAGGRHLELRIKKNPSGRHSKCTADEAVEVVRQMAGKYSDERIAATLNRLGLRTGAGNGWSDLCVRTLRYRLGVAEFDPAAVDSTTMTLEQAAEKLGVSITVVRRTYSREEASRNPGHSGSAMGDFYGSIGFSKGPPGSVSHQESNQFPAYSRR